MEASELFLISWAVGATILAVWFKHQARARGIAMLALTLGIRYIAEGKAEVMIEDGQIRIKEKEDVTA